MNNDFRVKSNDSKMNEIEIQSVSSKCKQKEQHQNIHHL